MKQKNLSSNAVLILANMVPLVGVLFFGWDGRAIFVIYILETVLIGVINVLKMLTVYILNGTKNEPPPSPGDNVSGWGLIPFFIFHYNFFIFVQSVLFFAFSSIWKTSASTQPFDLGTNFSNYLTGDTKLAVISLAIANAYYFINDFIMNDKYRTETMASLMFQPYKRIFVQQFVVILGGFIFMLSGSPAAVAVLFIVLKTVADYLSANYGNNPKIKKWIVKQTEQNSKKPMTNDEINIMDDMFGGGNK